MNDNPSWARDDEPYGTMPDEIAPVWDRVTEEYPNVIQHICGTKLHGELELKHCIRAFHTVAIRICAPVTPERLLKVFDLYPEGAFAMRVGAAAFKNDIVAIWQKLIEEQAEENARKRKQKPSAKLCLIRGPTCLRQNGQTAS